MVRYQSRSLWWWRLQRLSTKPMRRRGIQIHWRHRSRSTARQSGPVARHPKSSRSGVQGRGHLQPLVLPDDIGGLPDEAVDLTKVQTGSRDAVIWRPIARVCKRAFVEGGAKDDAMAEALRLNAQFPAPQPESWVAAKVGSWWRATLENGNQFGAGYQRRNWMQAYVGDPPYLALLVWLKEQNGPRSMGFMIADGVIGTHLPGWWSLPKLRHYRRRLQEDGWIVMIQKPVKGRSAIYAGAERRLKSYSSPNSWGAEINTLSSKKHPPGRAAPLQFCLGHDDCNGRHIDTPHPAPTPSQDCIPRAPRTRSPTFRWRRGWTSGSGVTAAATSAVVGIVGSPPGRAHTLAALLRGPVQPTHWWPSLAGGRAVPRKIPRYLSAGKTDHGAMPSTI